MRGLGFWHYGAAARLPLPPALLLTGLLAGLYRVQPPLQVVLIFFASRLPFRIFRALSTETKVASGMSQSKSGTSANSCHNGNLASSTLLTVTTLRTPPLLSDTMYPSNGQKIVTPPQNCQLMSITNCQQLWGTGAERWRTMASSLQKGY